MPLRNELLLTVLFKGFSPFQFSKDATFEKITDDFLFSIDQVLSNIHFLIIV